MSPRFRSFILLHIPKAAGTSLLRVVGRQFPARAVYALHPTRGQASLQAFRALPETERACYRLVHGHMPFGLHTALPRPCAYLTMLRDPVERITSYYYYVLQNPTHYLHEIVTTRGLDLEAFAASGLSRELDNGMTRILSGAGMHPNSPPVGACSAELLAQAQANLARHVAAVGVVECFDDSLLLFGRAFGWPLWRLVYTRVNATPGRAPRAQVPEAAARAIAERNALNASLYTIARGLVQSRLADYGPELEQHRAALARLNGLYRRVDALRTRGRRLTPAPALHAWRRLKQGLGAAPPPARQP